MFMYICVCLCEYEQVHSVSRVQKVLGPLEWDSCDPPNMGAGNHTRTPVLLMTEPCFQPHDVRVGRGIQRK